MAWNYSPKEFIKVYRKFMNWEWYADVNTKTLFLHCLLKANWKETEWHGIHLNAGEFITSWPKIAKETGLSIRQARTSFSRLEMTGELTARTTDFVTGKKITKGRIVTVNNWNLYQDDGRQNDRQNDRDEGRKTTGKRQATGQENDSRYKNIKNIQEDKNPPYNPPTGETVPDVADEPGEPWPDDFWE